MRVTVLTILFLFVSKFVSGQNDSIEINNNFTLESGISYLSLKDITFSPIVFSGFIPNVSLGFNQNRRNGVLWSADISISYGNIDYNNTYFSSTYTSAEVSFNYLLKVKSSENSKFYLGGQFSSVLNILDYEGFSSASWYTAQQLEPILLYNYTISEKQSITGQFSYPLVGLVSRPSYAGVDEFVVANSNNVPKILYSRMKLYSLNKLINPNFQLKYTYNLRKIIVSIIGNYSYLHVNSARKYFKNELGLMAELKLKI